MLLLNQRGLYDLAMGRWSRYTHTLTHPLDTLTQRILSKHPLTHPVNIPSHHPLKHALSMYPTNTPSQCTTLTMHPLNTYPLNASSQPPSLHLLSPSLYSMVTVANWLSSRIVLQRSDMVVPSKPTGTPGQTLSYNHRYTTYSPYKH